MWLDGLVFWKTLWRIKEREQEKTGRIFRFWHSWKREKWGGGVSDYYADLIKFWPGWWRVLEPKLPLKHFPILQKWTILIPKLCSAIWGGRRHNLAFRVDLVLNSERQGLGLLVNNALITDPDGICSWLPQMFLMCGFTFIYPA